MYSVSPFQANNTTTNSIMCSSDFSFAYCNGLFWNFGGKVHAVYRIFHLLSPNQLLLAKAFTFGIRSFKLYINLQNASKYQIPSVSVPLSLLCVKHFVFHCKCVLCEDVWETKPPPAQTITVCI